MKKSFCIIVSIIAVVSIMALRPALQSTRSALTGSDSFVLYSLEPTGDTYQRPNAASYIKGKEKFHHYVVLGKTPISDARTKADLIDALFKGIAETGGAAACFQPRHGIRATNGWRTIDLVICFECGHIDYHQFGKITHDFISQTPQPIFDRALCNARISLGKRGH